MTSTTHENGQALVPVPQKRELLRPVAAPREFLAVQEETREIIVKTLKNGVDYGTIPGAGSKRVMKKPGAEKLSMAFGTHPVYDVVEKEVDHAYKNVFRGKDGKEQTAVGLYRYVVRCRLEMPNGDVVCDALGSCSSLESKYKSRPHDVENTVLKMACKRALVAVVLNAFGLSDGFTQDLEDRSHDGDDEDEQPRRAPARARKDDDVHDAEYEEQPKTAEKPAAQTAWSGQKVAGWVIDQIAQAKDLEQMHAALERVETQKAKLGPRLKAIVTTYEDTKYAEITGGANKASDADKQNLAHFLAARAQAPVDAPAREPGSDDDAT